MRKDIRRLYQHQQTKIRGYRVNPHHFKSNVVKSIIAWYFSINEKDKCIEEGFWSLNNDDENLHTTVINKLVTSYDFYL